MTASVLIVNHATVQLPFDLDALVAALQEYVSSFLAPIWGCPASVELAGRGAIPRSAYPLYLADTSDVAGALGYHEVLRRQPAGFAFLKTTMDDGEDPAVTISHELAEMLVDPSTRLVFRGPAGSYYAGEVADAVEEQTFQVNGLNMSDFVYPAWFGSLSNPPGTAPQVYDYLSACKSPGQVLPGGYMSIWQPSQGWTEQYGDQKAADHVARKGPLSRYHRRKRLHVQAV